MNQLTANPNSASSQLVSGQRIAFIQSSWHRDIVDQCRFSFMKEIAAKGFSEWQVDVFDVPGAFELPLAAQYLAQSGRYAGVACLGAVIRGETSHYDHVCAEAARGIQDVQLRTGVPCAFGVLTVETMEQALARSGGGKRDQGEHAAEAVLALAALRDGLAT